jgi:hypothetical protein
MRKTAKSVDRALRRRIYEGGAGTGQTLRITRREQQVIGGVTTQSF